MQLLENRRTLRIDQSQYMNELLEKLYIMIDKYKKIEVLLIDYNDLRLAIDDNERIDQREYQGVINSFI